jgi:AcrR family transcriptional regulator
MFNINYTAFNTMARRSDHTRKELEQLALEAGAQIIAEEGFANFSARKVARKIGYTIGTIYNVFESHDDFILHINATTLRDMASFIRSNVKQDSEGEEAVGQIANAYLCFTKENYNRWSALFEYRLPQGMAVPSWYMEEIRSLFDMVEHAVLPLCRGDRSKASRAAKTLWASIHGICQLGLTGRLDTVEAEATETLVDSLIKNYLKGLQ